MGDFLKKDINLKILSIVFAIFLWIYVYYKENPFQENQAIATFVVPVEIIGLSSDVTVVNSPSQVLMTVRGNKDIIPNLSVKDKYLSATVNLSNKGAGVYKDVPVETNTLVGQIESVEPKSIDITIDNLEVREFSVVPDFKGLLPQGYILKRDKIVLKPDKVKLKGPYEIIAKVDKVTVTVDLVGKTVSFQKNLLPVILGVNGKVMEGIDINQKEINTSVEISSDKISKTLPIVPWLYGTLPDGYTISEVLLHPLTATIESSPQELDSIKVIKTGPIDITGKDRDVVLNEILMLPAKNGKFLSDNTVRVLVRIAKKSQKIK